MTMESAPDASSFYGRHYYQHYTGAPYDRSAKWIAHFSAMADGIVREASPRSVLDVGCAIGLLVEALRDRGVDAHGIDISAYAIDRVRDDIKPFCRVASVAEPLPGRYDLVVCQEVLEHLPPDQADRAVAHLCAASDDILFSSTPQDFAETTHLNVRPPDYWTGLFARHGFVRDVDFDAAAFMPPWGARYRRSAEPLHRVAAAYERRLWAATQEVRALRQRALDLTATVSRQEEAIAGQPAVQRLQATIAEQQEHLDALQERIQYMSDHENELRRMLLDAHQQLLEREAPPRPGSNATVESLQRLVQERTEWAQRAVAELEQCRKLAAERHALIEERTAWATRVVAELEAIRARNRRGLRGLVRKMLRRP